MGRNPFCKHKIHHTCHRDLEVYSLLKVISDIGIVYLVLFKVMLGLKQPTDDGGSVVCLPCCGPSKRKFFNMPLCWIRFVPQSQSGVNFVQLLRILCLAWAGWNRFENKISLDLASRLQTLSSAGARFSHYDGLSPFLLSDFGGRKTGIFPTVMALFASLKMLLDHFLPLLSLIWFRAL